MCSTSCASAILRVEQTLNGLRARSVSSLRVTGIFSIALAIGFIGFGVYTLCFERDSFMLVYLSIFALIFGAGGVAFLRIAKRKEQRDIAA